MLREFPVTQDIIFKSGKNFSIKKIISLFFEFKNMDYKQFIKIDKKLYRKNEKYNLISIKSNTNKLLKKWKWVPKIYGKKLISKLLSK